MPDIIDSLMSVATCAMCGMGVHFEAGRVACNGCALPTDCCLCDPLPTLRSGSGRGEEQLALAARGAAPPWQGRGTGPSSSPPLAIESSSMAFKGWPLEAVEFFEDLTADNSRSYWQEHKDAYERFVREPMLALLGELAPEFGEGKVSRPNRDTRFSTDKSPYKTAIAARLDNGGYIQFSAAGLAAGCGMFHMAPDQLDRYRQSVDDDDTGEELEVLVADVAKAGVRISARETLKSAPKGYPQDHPRLGLLRNKGLIAWKQWPGGPWLAKRSAKDRVVELLRATAPINDWLADNVGPSTVPKPRR